MSSICVVRGSAVALRDTADVEAPIPRRALKCDRCLQGVNAEGGRRATLIWRRGAKCATRRNPASRSKVSNVDSAVGIEHLPAIAMNLQEMANGWRGLPRVHISEYGASCVARSGYTTLRRSVGGEEFATRLQVSLPPQKIELILEIK